MIKNRERKHTQDPLTGLLSVSHLKKAMTDFFKKNRPDDFTVVCVDIAGFHRFNTMFGYEMGDTLLREMGKCISSQYMCGARINGDVFLFLVNNSQQEIEKIDAKLKNFLEVKLGAEYLQLFSYNFGFYPLGDGPFFYREVFDSVLLALRAAKEDPKKNYAVYDQEMKERARLYKNIEMAMIHALAKGEFILYMQPKFFMNSLECCGAEALVRWDSEQMGFLSPGEFVPIFEENGFITEIDFYMLESILTRLQVLYDKGEKILPISVNQSYVTITYPNYVLRLRDLVSQYSFPLDLVEIEITETVIGEDYDRVIKLVETYHDIGFTVAMDDFGKGYSSLNTLRNLDVDVLKIDKDFLSETETSTKGKKIIDSVVSLAKNLGIVTVCEGIETDAQMAFLKSINCDIVQGFLVGRPMPLAEFEKKYLKY